MQINSFHSSPTFLSIIQAVLQVIIFISLTATQETLNTLGLSITPYILEGWMSSDMDFFPTSDF